MPTELFVYDEIVSPAESKLWGVGVDAESFAAQLRAAPEGDLEVRINSPGGDVDNGLAIYNLLCGERAKGRRVTCIVDGGAHSIASVIAMAGDEVRMAEASRMLVHQPRMFAAGTAEDMRQAVQRLDAASETIRSAYRAKTGQADAALDALMSAETFLTPEAAVRLRFADQVMAPPARESVKACAWSPSTLRHPLSRAVARLLPDRPPVAAAKDKTMPKNDPPEVELVPKAELASAQSRVTELEQKLAEHTAAAPVLAAVKAMTGKDRPADQIAELAALGARAAQVDGLQEQLGGERERLTAQLRGRNVPPVVIKSLEAACDAAGGDLTALRAAVASPAVKGLEPKTPAAPSRKGDPTAPKAAVLTPEVKAEYRRCGITDEAVMLKAEKSRLGLTNVGGDEPAEEQE